MILTAPETRGIDLNSVDAPGDAPRGGAPRALRTA
jgi:hypothetical protein